jgi:chemotaxis protein MotB
MAANEKKQTIVIKKITIAAAGAHGGSWKVAFADFMTAMMAFFLVMWLVNQSEEVKKSVSDYFSTPSIIEYNFSNYGVELTLEKLFLDLMNQPLKALEDFITPTDKKPNVLDMGLKKIQSHYLIEKVGDFAENVNISQDEVTFDIPAETLFKHKSSETKEAFVEIMENIRGIVEGLKDANIYINSELPYIGANSAQDVKNVAEARLDLVSNKVEQGMKNEGVDIYGKISVEKVGALEAHRDTRGYIKFRIQQKDKPQSKKDKAAEHAAHVEQTDGADATAAKPVVNAHRGTASVDSNDKVYDNFVDQLTKKAEGRDNSKTK